MGNKLAIMGHPTRGKEVIELLEMMGGKNTVYYGTDIKVIYTIDDKGIIRSLFFNDTILMKMEYDIFTLEEFLEKYPFKVCDKVFLYDNITEGCVTGMEWDEDKGTVKYCVYTSSECWCDVKELLKWNALDLVEKHYEEQCEEMMKEITLKHLYELGMENKKREYDELRMPLDDDDKLATEATIMGKKILPPDGYLVGKITQTDNGMLVEYVEKKPKYPKLTNLLECKEILGEKDMYQGVSGYKGELLTNFQRLLIFRDAYWKIAGEEMGLDKPWEPDWKHLNRKFYCIYNSKNNIVKNVTYGENKNLVFPTAEMRDAFYENFKDLIEQCKELL